MHFLQRSPDFSKTWCKPLNTSSCLWPPFSWLEKPRNCMGRVQNWTLRSAWKSEIAETHQNIHHTVHISPHAISRLFQPRKGKEISKRSTVCSRFFEKGWSVVVHHLAREIIRKRDCHRTSTKFRLGVISWVHELFKRPLYVIKSYTRAYTHIITKILSFLLVEHTNLDQWENRTN
jgi:hypothetical protein